MAVKKICNLLICFTFLVSFLAPFKVLAANTIDSAETINLGETISGSLSGNEEVWYKIYPGQSVSTYSHIKFTVEGESSPIISVFPDVESARNGLSYENYVNQYETVEFPIAWEGPFYIKITGDYSGMFSLSTESLLKEPDEHGGGICIAEETTKNQANAIGVLSSMRTIRDSLLNNTALGKELVSLYYNVSKKTILEAIKDKNYRDSIAQDLSILTNLITEFGKIADGQSSTYVVTEKDYNSIVNLKNTITEKTAPTLDETINKYWAELNLDNIKGKTLTALLQENGLISDLKDYNDNEIIVSFKGDSSKTLAVQTAAKLLGSTVQVNELKTKNSIIENTFLVKYGKGNSPEKMAAELEKLPNVEYAEPNYRAQAFTQDIQYSYHWSLENNGQNGGIAGSDIRFPMMEKLLEGKKLGQTLIAVVDTGTNYNLKDLNSVTRNDLGKDFVNFDMDAMDDNDHGTHVAGTIAAINNNHYSMTGINQHANIIPVKSLNEDGQGSMADVALGIRHAVDQGAKVINLSLGSSSFSQAVETQLIYAKQKGVTVVAAAGNDGEEQLSYPGSSENAIGVGATDNTDIRADFSNFGQGLDIVAPGVDIPSLVNNGEVMYASGTSMAAPHVAAVAGLIYSIRPDVTPDEVKTILTENTVDLGTEGFDFEYGWGRLDAEKVVKALGLNNQKPNTPTVNPVDDNDTVVTGISESGLTVAVTRADTTIGTATVNTDGSFSVSVNKQKAGTVLKVTALNKGVSSDAVTIKVSDKTAPGAPQVNEVTNYDKKVSGKMEANAKVIVKVGTSKIGEGTADKYGKFSVVLKTAQKAGTVLSVTASDKAGNISKESKVTVSDKIAPAAPVVNEVKDYDKKVTGKAEKYSKVTVKRGKTTLGTGTVDKYGNFTVTLKSAQKAGTILIVTATDKAGNVSKETSVKVVDKTAPGTPKVNKVTARSTSVTGTAEANSTVYVKGSKGVIGSSKAGKNGTYSVKIPKQKAGTILYVYAKDSSGNTGKSTKITVQK